MATLNIKKIGSLVLLEYTGHADRLLSSTNPSLDIQMPLDGTSNILISLGGQNYSLTTITDLQVEGVSATNQADAFTKLATVFPEAGSAGGGGGITINGAYASNAEAITGGLQDGDLYQSTTRINGSAIILRVLD